MRVTRWARSSLSSFSTSLIILTKAGPVEGRLSRRWYQDIRVWGRRNSLPLLICLTASRAAVTLFPIKHQERVPSGFPWLLSILSFHTVQCFFNSSSQNHSDFYRNKKRMRRLLLEDNVASLLQGLVSLVEQLQWSLMITGHLKIASFIRKQQKSQQHEKQFCIRVARVH